MKNLLRTLLIFLCTLGISQAQEKKIVQFSGIVYNGSSSNTNAIVPYVTIINKETGKLSSANYKGYFSFVAYEKDSLEFVAIGYKSQTIVIPSNLPEKKYTAQVRLKSEAINLPEVKIYPWASIDEFNREFITMKFADDDLEIARKNLTSDKLLALAKTLPRDAQEMQSINFQNKHIELSNQNINQRANNPLLNPFAWGALMQQIFQGDKSRSE